jgi:hypothetical protein
VGIKELRRMVLRHSCKSIPPTEWIDTCIALFDSMKEALMSSPVLARFELSKPVFLKTNVSTIDMGFILMHLDGSDESKAVMEKLVAGDNNEFDTSMTSAWLWPILFD